MLESLRQDIQKLIALYESERQRADELSRKLSESEATMESYRTQITKLNRQIDNLQLTGIFAPQGDNEMAKKRIDKLIREIDNCIKLMEK